MGKAVWALPVFHEPEFPLPWRLLNQLLRAGQRAGWAIHHLGKARCRRGNLICRHTSWGGCKNTQTHPFTEEQFFSKTFIGEHLTDILFSQQEINLFSLQLKKTIYKWPKSLSLMLSLASAITVLWLLLLAITAMLVIYRGLREYLDTNGTLWTLLLRQNIKPSGNYFKARFQTKLKRNCLVELTLQQKQLIIFQDIYYRSFSYFP